MSLNGNNILAGASGQTTGYDIDQSLRFEEDDASKLSRTFTSAGNRKTWTLSTWVKLSGLDTTDYGELFNGYDSGSDTGFTAVYWYNGKLRVAGWGTTWRETSQEFRDPSAWYHLVVAFDTTESAANDRCKIYVNGSQVTAFGTNNALSQDTDYGINGAWVHQIGQDNSASSSRNFSGYMGEFHFIDGTALTPASFGETNEDTNQWQAIEYTGSYGTNGFYLKFQDSSALGDDSSGNTNDFTPTNLAATDQVLDSPTNNFCTMNPLDAGGSNNTFSEGNLKYVVAAQNTNEESTATIGFSSGKWYWEHYLISTTTSAGYFKVGLKSDDGSNYWNVRGSDGEKDNNGTTASSSVSYTTTNVVGVAVDMDNGKWWVSVNGTFVGDPAAGSGELHSNLSGTVLPYILNAGSGGTHTGVANFGQDSSFAGNKTSGAAGSDFYYTPPTGFKALSTDNLSDPSIADPTAYFNTVAYSGNGSTQSITTGLQPDFTWIKGRSYASNHRLIDSVRGAGERLSSNLTDAETTESNGLTSFNSDGFSVGTEGGYNNSGQTFVSWNWKAGGTASSNTDGSITSSVSANTDAGFSIISYAGNSSTATVGHGLSQGPEIIFVKSRSNTHSWSTGATPIGWTERLEGLNNTNAAATNDAWDDTAPSSSVIYLTSDGSSNETGNDYICYAFHSVDGYSKVGSYTGSGSSDGPFVYTGFRPAFVMVKSSNAIASWWMGDTARETYNGGAGTYGWLQANASDAEADYTAIDHLSNGFKLRDVHGGLNGSGNTYLYLAFAESPFKTSNAR